MRASRRTEDDRRNSLAEPITGEVRPRGDRKRVVLLAASVFLLALAVRAYYLYEVRSIPFHEHLVVDARAYDAWAREIAAGDVWGDEVFYQAPAYPYFLAAVYAITDGGPRAARVAQVLLGACSCVIVYLAGRKLFGGVAGAVSALLLAFYPPALFFDGIIQKASLGMFLTCLLLLALLAAQQRPAAWRFALCGLIGGLLALTRENTLLLLTVLPLWIAWWFRGRSWRLRARHIGALATGVAAVLLPIGFRNYAVGRTFALTTSQMGTNFFIGNHARATGLYAPLVPGQHDPVYERRDAARIAERAAGRQLTPGEVSDFWFKQGLHFMRTQPLGWARLMLRKTALVWNHFEVPDAQDMYIYARWSGMLRALSRVLHFGVVVPLAAAGVVLTWRRRRELSILYLMMAVTTVSVAAFYVFGRYRFPLVPPLAILAGAGLTEIYGRLRTRTLRPLALAVAVAGVAAIGANWTLVPAEEGHATSYVNLGLIYRDLGRTADAEHYFQLARKADPEYAYPLHCLGVLRARQHRPGEAEAFFRNALRISGAEIQTHVALADLLVGQRRYDKAAPHYEAALAVYPQYIRARAGVVVMEYSRGTLTVDAAIARFRGIVAEEPENAQFHRTLGVLLRDVGDLAQAELSLREAVRLASGSAPTHNDLGVVLGRQGKLEEAAERFARAAQLDTQFADAQENLALALATADRLDDAIVAYERALDINPDNAESHRNLGKLFVLKGRFDEALAQYEKTLALDPNHEQAKRELALLRQKLSATTAP